MGGIFAIWRFGLVIGVVAALIFAGRIVGINVLQLLPDDED